MEDDENKRNHLVTFVRETVITAEILTAASYASGLKRIVNDPPDLILLDMTLPTFDISAYEHGGESALYGGSELLEQMDYHKICVPVIVVTQFDRFGDADEAVTLAELDAQLQREYPRIYHGAIYYDSTREGWKSALRKRLIALGMIKRTRS